MNKQQIATANAKLRSIKPGVNYPTQVIIKERVNGKLLTIIFNMCSYFVGMYCAVHINGHVATQTGDHNNKIFMAKLKCDIAKAIDRGATVEFGSIMPIKRN